MEVKSNITAAIIKARKNFKPLALNKGAQRFKHASYGAIKESVEEALANEGVNIYFETAYSPVVSTWVISMVLKHDKSGESISSSLPLIDDANSQIKDANQRIGASITYTMRNLARCLLSLHADESDLDNYIPRQKNPEASEVISDEELNYIIEQISSCDNPRKIESDILSFNEVADLEQLPASKLKNVLAYIIKNKNK